jgi:hypothetical protein
LIVIAPLNKNVSATTGAEVVPSLTIPMRKEWFGTGVEIRNMGHNSDM